MSPARRRGVSSQATASRAGCFALGLALLAGAAGCRSPRETLLQLEIELPAGAPARRLDVEVGAEGSGKVKRSFTGALPAGATLGLDMHLPRSLAGVQPLLVAALDGAGCVVARQTASITLWPGERVQGGLVTLMAQARPTCPTLADGGPMETRDAAPPDAGAVPLPQAGMKSIALWTAGGGGAQAAGPGAVGLFLGCPAASSTVTAASGATVTLGHFADTLE